MNARHARGGSGAYDNDTSVYSRYSYDPAAAHERSQAEAADVFAHAEPAAPRPAAGQPAVPESYTAAYMAATRQAAPRQAPMPQAAAPAFAAQPTAGVPGGSQFPGFESLNEAKRRSGGRIAGRVLGVLLALLIVAVAVVGVLAAKYMHDLDAVLEKGEPPMTTQLLTPAKGGEPFYMLVVGLDTRELGDLGPGTFSDAIMLVRVDMSNKQVTMVSIPRDTRWTMPDGTVDKINSAYFNGGVDSCVEAIEQKAGVKVSHVMVFDVSDMEEIVDAIGGVEINVDVPMHKDIIGTDHSVDLEPGLQTLNGEEAQVYTRDRFAYETDQDAHRQSNIRTLMEAVVRKVADGPKTQIPGALMNLAPYLHTDMRSMDFLGLGWQYLWSPADGLKFYSGTAPSSGDLDPWYDDRWYCFENPQGWSELMAVVEAGGDPSGLDVEGTAITHEERNAAA